MVAMRFGTNVLSSQETESGGGGSSVSLIAFNGASVTASPYNMNVTIPEDVTDGVIVISWTRDSDGAISDISITSGTATEESEKHGKYQYTAAYLRTYIISIKNVTANSTFTCRASGKETYFTYAVYKFS